MPFFKNTLRRAFTDAFAQWPQVREKEKERMLQAALVGNVFVMKEIVARYPKEAVNWQDKGGLCALHCAAAGRRGDIAAWLLSENADLTLQDKDGLTPLHYAAQAVDLDALELLIAAGAPLETRNEKGETPLMFGVDRNRPAHARVLVLAGADIHAATNDGDTPLQHARRHDAAMQNVLLGAQAELEKRRRDAETAARAKKAADIAAAAQAMTGGLASSISVRKPLRLRN